MAQWYRYRCVACTMRRAELVPAPLPVRHAAAGGRRRLGVDTVDSCVAMQLWGHTGHRVTLQRVDVDDRVWTHRGHRGLLVRAPYAAVCSSVLPAAVTCCGGCAWESGKRRCDGL